jgi:hypothetical protein
MGLKGYYYYYLIIRLVLICYFQRKYTFSRHPAEIEDSSPGFVYSTPGARDNRIPQCRIRTHTRDYYRVALVLGLDLRLPVLELGSYSVMAYSRDAGQMGQNSKIRDVPGNTGRLATL